MRRLGPLRARLGTLVRRALLRRLLAWILSSIIALSAGTATAAILGLGAAVQIGLLLAALSALPIVLLWPLPPDILERGLRRLDTGSVFESLLESPPGPARDLLAGAARIKCGELAAGPPEKPPPSRRFSFLALAAIAAFAALEAGSIAFRGGLILRYSGPERSSAPARDEEGGFGPPPGGESALAAQGGRAQAADPFDEEPATEGEAETGGAARRPASRRREAMEDLPLPESSAGGAAEHDFAQRGGGEEAGGAGGREGDGAAEGQGQAEGEDIGGEGLGKAPAAQGKARGRGFSDSAGTGIPSPLVDYRARFARAYAERTGTHIAASGPLSLKELGEIQRRFFRSFSLDLGAEVREDPFEAGLRRRWRELRGGIR